MLLLVIIWVLLRKLSDKLEYRPVKGYYNRI